MAKGGQVQLGHGDLPPDLDHIPQADVIQKDQHPVPKGDQEEIFQESLLRDPVFGSVEEDKVGILENLPVFQENGGIAQIIQELDQAAVGKIFLP
jgi:hypothetical protein